MPIIPLAKIDTANDANPDQTLAIDTDKNRMQLTTDDTGVASKTWPLPGIGQTGLTADTGSIASGATKVYPGENVFSTVATAGDSAIVPADAEVNTGDIIKIRNSSATSMDVFPAVGGNLGAGVNTAIAIPTLTTLSLRKTSVAITWAQITADTLTADTGSAQADATQCIVGLNEFTVVGTAGDSALAPADADVFQGDTFTVANNHATNSMDVFPVVGGDLGKGANTAVPVVALASRTFHKAKGAGVWA